MVVGHVEVHIVVDTSPVLGRRVGVVVVGPLRPHSGPVCPTSTLSRPVRAGPLFPSTVPLDVRFRSNPFSETPHDDLLPWRGTGRPGRTRVRPGGLPPPSGAAPESRRSVETRRLREIALVSDGRDPRDTTGSREFRPGRPRLHPPLPPVQLPPVPTRVLRPTRVGCHPSTTRRPGNSRRRRGQDRRWLFDYSW